VLYSICAASVPHPYHTCTALLFGGSKAKLNQQNVQAQGIHASADVSLAHTRVLQHTWGCVGHMIADEDLIEIKSLQCFHYL
jgi:hypothetical protein